MLLPTSCSWLTGLGVWIKVVFLLPTAAYSVINLIQEVLRIFKWHLDTLYVIEITHGYHSLH